MDDVKAAEGLKWGAFHLAAVTFKNSSDGHRNYY